MEKRADLVSTKRSSIFRYRIIENGSRPTFLPREVIPSIHGQKVRYHAESMQCCQLSRIIRETPDFETLLPVSRLESEISRVIAEVCNFL